MSAKTKIIIMKKREVIYTAIFAVLAIVFLILMVLMFRPGGGTSGSSSEKKLYQPGVYTTPITLNNNVMDLQVRVDQNHINSISLVNLSETAAAAFPLMEPALEKLAAQICDTQSVKEIYYEEASQYTSQMLLGAIEDALKLARDQA